MGYANFRGEKWKKMQILEGIFGKKDTKISLSMGERE